MVYAGELESKGCGSCKRKLEDLRKAPRYIGEPSELQAHVDYIHCWRLKSTSSKRTQLFSGLHMNYVTQNLKRLVLRKLIH